MKSSIAGKLIDETGKATAGRLLLPQGLLLGVVLWRAAGVILFRNNLTR